MMGYLLCIILNLTYLGFGHQLGCRGTRPGRHFLCNPLSRPNNQLINPEMTKYLWVLSRAATATIQLLDKLWKPALIGVQGVKTSHI